MNSAVLHALAAIPFGASGGQFAGRRYGITKTAFAAGHSLKLYARELGGVHFISFNLYFADSPKALLRPCEMPAQEVIEFLLGVELRVSGGESS